MIDFIRLRFVDKRSIESYIIDKNNFPELQTGYKYHLREVRYPYKVNVECIEIRVNEKSAYLKNSLHKLHNNIYSEENHNHNDFTYSNLVSTIDYLDKRLGGLRETKLTQLEFGLNIELPVPAEDILSKNILLRRLAPPNSDESFSGRGKLKQFNHSHCYFKIYDKAKQFRLSHNIIRFELKYKSSKGFNPLGVYNIHDLKDKNCLRKLFQDLLKRFDELTIIDDISASSRITSGDNIKLDRYLRMNYWKSLSHRKDRNKKSREKKAFQSLLIKYDLLKTKQLLRDNLIIKFIELIDN